MPTERSQSENVFLETELRQMTIIQKLANAFDDELVAILSQRIWMFKLDKDEVLIHIGSMRLTKARSLEHYF